MKPRHFLFILAIFFIKFSAAQHLNENVILRLEQDSAFIDVFTAKFYNLNGKPIEYWTLATTASDINSQNFNELVIKKEIIPHGKHYIFYPNSRLKFEESYELGERKGEIKGYYNSGKIKFIRTHEENTKEKITHYNENGTIRKTEELESPESNGITFLDLKIKKINNENNYFDANFYSTASVYYPDGKIFSEINHLYGNKQGKYLSYYPDGKIKREVKFENDDIKSEKCYDPSGKKIDCMPFITSAEFPGGFDALKTEMGKISYESASVPTDTLTCDITLSIDSSGKAVLSDFHSSEGKPLFNALNTWVRQLPPFKPATRDGICTESEIKLAFPVLAGKIFWLKEASVFLTNNWNQENQEETIHVLWEFKEPDDITYFIVEKMPEFPGGELALRKFIAENIRYPAEAQKHGIQGKVYVTFVIGKNGEVTSSRIAKGIDPLLDSEALRVINSLPLWNPGMQKGKPVSVSYTIPVSFNIQ